MKMILVLLGLFAYSVSQAADCTCTCSCKVNGTSIDGSNILVDGPSIDGPAVPVVPPVVVQPPPPVVPPVAVNGDPGAGLWTPPGMPKRTVADQSGNSTDRTSYVPGCLNGLFSPNSGSGCSAQATFNGGVSLGSGKQLVLRYKALHAAGTTVKSIRARSYDGGNVGVNLRVWLSASPTIVYADVPTACKATSTRTPTVFTGPGYCPLTPGATYYFGIEYDEAASNRFQIDELQADFL